MRIFLIGFMGSGKSHNGRLLAEALNLSFLDLDELIETGEGKTIAEIFAESGEWSFRNQEACYLRKSLKKENFVMACGGGTPLYRANISRMNHHGLTFFLDVPPKILEARLRPELDKRPLLADQQNIKAFLSNKLAERRPTYEKAHIKLRLDNPDTDAVRLMLDHIKQLNDDTTIAPYGPAAV